MQARDHYLEVTPTRGTALILMRLSDAARDLEGLAGVRGIRTHRSWWVNIKHVTGQARLDGGGLELLTTRGTRIPVSRGQRASVAKPLGERKTSRSA